MLWYKERFDLEGENDGLKSHETKGREIREN